MINPAVICHHQVCRRRPVTVTPEVAGPQAASSVIAGFAGPPNGVINCLNTVQTGPKRAPSHIFSPRNKSVSLPFARSENN